MRTCHRHYPGRFNGACSLVYLHCQRPSPCNSKVCSCNCFFEACLALTHVMACTLAESPSDPLHRKLRQLRYLHCRFDCYRVERTSSRAGVAPAEVQRLSRRTVSPTSSTLGCEANAKVAQVTSLVVEVYKPPLSLIESQFRCDFRKLSGNQKRASSVEVNRKQVQPVSLHTR
jgi:hypothetical protein